MEITMNNSFAWRPEPGLTRSHETASCMGLTMAIDTRKRAESRGTRLTDFGGFYGRARRLSLLEGEAGSKRLERFWRKVDRRGGCWLWTAATGAGGYGVFKLSSRVTTTAHRLALVAATGRDPIGLEVLHACDNPLCCRPDHMRWGTRQENENDKGRTIRSRRTSRRRSRHT